MARPLALCPLPPPCQAMFDEMAFYEPLAAGSIYNPASTSPKQLAVKAEAERKLASARVIQSAALGLAARVKASKSRAEAAAARAAATVLQRVIYIMRRQSSIRHVDMPQKQRAKALKVLAEETEELVSTRPLSSCRRCHRSSRTQPLT